MSDVKDYWTCWDCDTEVWRNTTRRVLCPQCRKEMRLTTKPNCAVCGRQIVNEDEAYSMVCTACSCGGATPTQPAWVG